MKNTTILLTLLFGISIFAQNQKYQAFPITSNSVSATPISIPAPNKTPVTLAFFETRMIPFSYTESTRITASELLDLNGKELTIRIFHTIKSESKEPIYAGGWFYDKSDKALDVGYIPKMIFNNKFTFTDVILKFNQLPITTNYLEVMLFQDGKTIAKRRFKAAFEWKEVASSFAIKQMEKVISIKDLPIGELAIYAPDLELTEIKVKLANNGVIEYPSNCVGGENHIYITNIGSKISEPYQVSIGYYKSVDNRFSQFIEVALFNKPSLKAGKQTYCKVKLPQYANNIEARIKYTTNKNEETNLTNNTLQKRCKFLR